MDSGIDEKTYLAGVSLDKALITFADDKLRKELKQAHSDIFSSKEQNTNTSFWETLSDGLINIQISGNRYKEVIAKLEDNFLNLIGSGALIGFGYTLPRNLKDAPVKIPADIFLSGKLFWDKSELIFKNIEFTGVRIIKNTQLSEKESLKEINKSIEITKSSFADLDSEQHITEKEAAEYLGLAVRTLQGYRVRGGGPLFRKFKKAVRYRVQDLKDWAEESGKRNTSQN